MFSFATLRSCRSTGSFPEATMVNSFSYFFWHWSLHFCVIGLFSYFLLPTSDALCRPSVTVDGGFALPTSSDHKFQWNQCSVCTSLWLWIIPVFARPYKTLQDLGSLFPCLSPSPSLLSGISGLPGSSNMGPRNAYSYPRAFTPVLPAMRTPSSPMFAWNPSLFHSWIRSNITWSESLSRLSSPSICFSSFTFLHRLIRHTHTPPLTLYYILIDVNPDYIFVEGRGFINH